MPEIANLNIDQIMVYLFRTYSPRKVLKTAGSYLVVNTCDTKDNKHTSESECESELESVSDCECENKNTSESKCENKSDTTQIEDTTNHNDVSKLKETPTSDCIESMRSIGERMRLNEEMIFKDETDIDENIVDTIDENNDEDDEDNEDNKDGEEDDDNESKEINIKVNINVNMRKTASKIADTSRKFKTKRITSKNIDGHCNGLLASGKPCEKTNFVNFNLCKRCYGKLKEKGKVRYDDKLEHFYRDVKFTVDDPNGLFLKGQTIRQYVQFGYVFEFTGLKPQTFYYIYTKKDVEDKFKHCSIITTANPFVKSPSLEECNLSKYEHVDLKSVEKESEEGEEDMNNDEVDEDEEENDEDQEENDENNEDDVEDKEETDGNNEDEVEVDDDDDDTDDNDDNDDNDDTDDDDED